MEYTIPIIEFRRVVSDSCDELFKDKKMAEIAYRHIMDNIEDYLYECRNEEDEG